jgi:hypothetical protein
MVATETGLPKLGRGYMTYELSNLSTGDARRLRAAMKELRLTGNASVIYMAEERHDHLLAFTIAAQSRGLFR